MFYRKPALYSKRQLPIHKKYWIQTHPEDYWNLTRDANERHSGLPHNNGPLQKGALMRLEVDDENKKKALQRRVQEGSVTTSQ